MKRIIASILTLAILICSATLIIAQNTDKPLGSATQAKTTPSEWAEDSVKLGLEAGILDKNKTYYYGTFITREEFCELIYNLVKEATNEIDGFVKTPAYKNSTISAISIADSKSNAVYELVRTGIIYGTTVEEKVTKIPADITTDVEKYEAVITFSPDDHLTREQAATIMTRAIALFPQVSYTERFYNYADINNISDWAKNSVQVVSNGGIMVGFGHNMFHPKDLLSTEEAVVAVMRLYDLITADKNEVSDMQNASFSHKLNLHMPGDENYMFSPLSIKMLLAMLANGAENETRNEILKATDIDDLEEFNKYSESLIKQYSETDAPSLNIANSIWVNTDLTENSLFKEEYKALVAKYYNAKASEVTNDNAVKEVNGWVNEKTHGKIPRIIDTADFWAALVNAIYFKGAWQDDFNPAATMKDTFTDGVGKKHQIDFMNKTGYLQYADTGSSQILSLPYTNYYESTDADGNFIHGRSDLDAQMYFIMCDDDIDVESLIDGTQLSSTYIKLSVPKFKIEYDTLLNDTLIDLGINTAFDKTNADFKSMMLLKHNYNLYLDIVLHKTFINVDEKGTEAAAVTFGGMAGATSVVQRPVPIEVKFNKPFYFIIKAGSETLFMGRYAYAE